MVRTGPVQLLKPGDEILWYCIAILVSYCIAIGTFICIGWLVGWLVDWVALYCFA
jgi:hypothetical protein